MAKAVRQTEPVWLIGFAESLSVHEFARKGCRTCREILDRIVLASKTEKLFSLASFADFEHVAGHGLRVDSGVKEIRK